MTQWLIDLKTHRAPEGLAWIRQFAAGYDLSQLESIRIEKGRSRKAVGVYGKCYFPTENRPFYRLHCVVPGPFPCSIHIRRPPLYMREDGTFPPTPAGCIRGVRCIDRRTGRQWYRIIGQTPLLDADEGVVWIFAHEIFHFLRRTRQIPGRNNEIQADAYGDAMLEAFRKERHAALITPYAAPPASARKTKVEAVKPRTPKPRATATPEPAPKPKPTPRPTSKPAVVRSESPPPGPPSAVAMLGQVFRSWMGLWSQPPAGKKAPSTRKPDKPAGRR